MEYVITVDIGTTSCKTLAFDFKGSVLDEINIPYPIISNQKDFQEQDPEVILKAAKDGIGRIITKKLGDLRGISFSCAMHSLIVMDKSGHHATNSIIWADNRSKVEAEQLKNTKDGLEIYFRSGTPIHPMSPLCKLAWLKKHEPEIFYNADKFISIKEYVFFKFFGEYLVDHSIASATGLFDIYDLQWNEKALSYLEISKDQLSRCVPVTFSLIHLHPTIQKELGIKNKIPFIIGGSDGCLANLGSNSIKAGHASVTIGTSGAIRMACKSSKQDEKHRLFNYLLDENTFIIGGPINNGAVVLDWFKTNLLEDDSGSEEFFHEIAGRLKNISPGSEGLIFLPFLLGERAPIWDADARGVFFGIGINHGKLHFLRAMMEGVIYALYSIAQPLEELTGEIKIINAGGGFAQSDIWLQILSDIFNKKVVVNNSTQSSSLGAAMIAFKALGVYNSFEEMESMVSTIKEFVPEADNHIVYAKQYETYLSLYEALKNSRNKS